MDAVVTSPIVHEVRLTSISELASHPRNYRDHPEDQIAHLQQSITQHEFYRNVVVANDGTMLAGHGIVQAAAELGMTEVPAAHLTVGPDDPEALKILAGDNELARLAMIDDRGLSELLKQINDTDTAGLLGTGYDEAMLANLVMVTRHANEIRDIDEAAHWVGMPGYEGEEKPHQIVLSFENEQVRDEFMQTIGASVVQYKNGRVWSMWWPERALQTPASLDYVEDAE